MAETRTKQPADVLDYDVSFAHWFPLGDTITTATATVDPEGELSADSVQVSGLVVKVWISGGLDAKTYKVTVRATTAGGRVKETEFKVRVRDS